MKYDLVLADYIDALQRKEHQEAFMIYLTLLRIRCPQELIDWAEKTFTWEETNEQANTQKRND